MVKIYIIHIIRLLLKFFWLFPIAKNKIIFVAYDGTRYTCNPKYIYEYMQGISCDWDYVWVCDHAALGTHTNSVAFNTKIVSQNSVQYFYHCLTATVFITNDSVRSILPFRSKQKIINTWHGGGVYKSSGLGGNSQISSTDLFSINNMSQTLTWFLSSSEAFSQNMSEFYKIPIKKILAFGMPRNDNFFDGEKSNTLADKLRQDLKIPKDHNIVLYTPTFRGKVGSGSKSLSLDVASVVKSLEVRFKKPFWLLFRAHHADNVKLHGDRVIDVSSYPDSQDLLHAADVLISDYSSILWDYSLSLKPSFIFAPDLRDYENNDRGFSTNIDEWPFSIAKNNQELCLNIELFEDQAYSKNVNRHHRELKNYETGVATQRLVEEIILQTKEDSTC